MEREEGRGGDWRGWDLGGKESLGVGMGDIL